jgi:hypothetical protein
MCCSMLINANDVTHATPFLSCISRSSLIQRSNLGQLGQSPLPPVAEERRDQRALLAAENRLSPENSNCARLA